MKRKPANHLQSTQSPPNCAMLTRRILWLLLAGLWLWPLSLSAEIIDRVVAVVNNQVITLSDLQQEGAPVFNQIQQEGASAEEKAAALRAARQDLLGILIDRTLIEQRAAEMGLTVSEEEVEAAVSRIVARNNATLEDFRRELQARGSSEEHYRAQLKNQMLQSKLIGYEIRSRIVVTDAQVEKYYQNQYGASASPDGYHLLQIGVAWKEENGAASREEARTRAEQLRRMAMEGESFKELAANFSDFPSAVDGGDIGAFTREEMAPDMRETILPLQPGEISPLLKSRSGYQFFKLLSIKDDNILQQAPLAEVKDEIKNHIYQEEAMQRYEEWLRELREDAYIKELL